MSDHPYRNLNDHSFWKRAISTVPAAQVDPVVRGKFKCGPKDKVATAGSCFAQHISRYLSNFGFNYLVTENVHPLFAPWSSTFNYGTFTARFGNIYTARQLLQLLERAYGKYAPIERPWHDANRAFVDPFRPQIQPGGFVSEAELNADRVQHLAAVRDMFEKLDLFIFTLGLTEAWVSKEDGAVFPLCPGTAGGEFDSEKYSFVNFNANEVTADLQAAIAHIRSVNPLARIILTVSPVPLVATSMDRSVLVSTTYSKSVLRVAAEEIERAHPFVAYFPSYEIITGNYNRGVYFGDDLRSVTEEGIAHVMRLFLKHYTEGLSQSEETTDQLPAAPAETEQLQLMRNIASAICDEEVLDILDRASPNRSHATGTDELPSSRPSGT